MLQSLAGRHSVAIIVDQKLCYDLGGLRRHIGNQLGDSGALLVRKIELHVTRHALKFC